MSAIEVFYPSEKHSIFEKKKNSFFPPIPGWVDIKDLMDFLEYPGFCV